MNTRIFHLHALSALHVGTGQGIGAVDLPIARSRATNLPLVPGSALKGVLRDEAKEKWHVSSWIIFRRKINKLPKTFLQPIANRLKLLYFSDSWVNQIGRAHV